MAVRETLELDISQALQDINRLGNALETALQGIKVTVDTTGVAGTITAAVNSADDSITVEADAGDVTRSINAATDNADDNITVEGDASDVTRSINAAVENADDEITIRANTEGFRQDIEGAGGAATGVIAGLSSKFEGLGGPLAALGIGAFFKEAVDGASDLSEATSKVDNVFKGSAETIKAFGATSATSIGIASKEALDAAGTFGNLLTGAGLSSEAAAEMSKNILTLGADLGSFNNIPVPEALEKIKAGLLGETEPLSSLGIKFNQAAIEAKAMQLGLVKAGEDLTEGAKIQASYALITEKSANAQGDFAETSGGLANSTKITSASIQELITQLGSALLPTALELVKVVLGIAQALLPALQPLIQLIGTVFTPILSAIGTVVSALGTSLAPAIASISSLLGAVGGEIGKTLVAVFEGIRPTIDKILPVVVRFIELLADGLSTVLLSLAPVIPELGDAFGAMAEALAEVFKTISPLIPSIAHLFASISVEVIQIFIIAIRTLATIFTQIQPSLGLLVDAVINLFEALADPTVMQSFTDIALALAQALIAIAPILPPLIEGIATLINKFVEAGGVQGFAIIMEGLALTISAIATILGEVIRLITDFNAIARGWEIIVNAVKSAFGFLGESFGSFEEAFNRGLETMGSAFDTFESGIQTGIDAVTGFFKGLQSAIGDAAGAVADFFRGAFDKVTELIDTVKGLPGKITSALGDGLNVLKDFGANIVQGLVNGITGAAGKVLEAVKGLVAKIPGPFADLLGIHSPSRVMAALGEEIPAGVAVGIDSGASDVLDSIDSMTLGAINQASAATATIPLASATGGGSLNGAPLVGSITVEVNAAPGMTTAEASALGDAAMDAAVSRLAAVRAEVLRA